MSVNYHIHLLLGALACIGCGPSASRPDDPPEVESWLLGAFSSQKPPKFTMYHTIQRITFDADHTAFSQTLVVTGGSSDERLRTWEARTDEEVAVLFAEPMTGIKEFLVNPGEDCNTIEIQIVSQNGATSGGGRWYRGEVCVREQAPDAPGHYELAWCDEPPPPCDDL